MYIYIYIERASARVPPTSHSGGLGRRWSVRCIWLMMVMMMRMTRMMSVMIMVMKRRMMIMMIMCKNQFYVKDGRVSKGTRKHAHACPVCQTVVWSSCSCGQIKGKHDTPAGKPCKTKWHVPQEKDEKKRRLKWPIVANRWNLLH